MRVVITGRHMDVSAALHRYVESRIKRLERYTRNVEDVQVVLAVEKYRHMAEMVLTLNGRVIQAKTSTSEMYSSVDQVVDKVLRQVRKRKEQLVDHKPRHAKGRARAEAPPPPIVQTVRRPVQTLSVEDALDQLKTEPSGLLIFVSATSGRLQIVRKLENGAPQIIDPEPV